MSLATATALILLLARRQVRAVRVHVMRLTRSAHDSTRAAATAPYRRLTVHRLPVAVLRMRTRLAVDAAVAVVASTTAALLGAPRCPEHRLTTHTQTQTHINI